MDEEPQLLADWHSASTPVLLGADRGISIMVTKNFRKIAVATTLAASLGGGVVAANAAELAPSGVRATVHEATWYADNAMRAWGAGNASQASKYLTSGTQRALFGWKSVGGAGWVRTGSSTKGNITSVSYRNGAGSTVTLQVNTANRKNTTRVITYVNWTVGRTLATPAATKPATNAAPWVGTTQGYGPVKIGASIATLARQGYVTGLSRCGNATNGFARGAQVHAVNGRVESILLMPGNQTRAGIHAGSSEATLKATYGRQLTFLGRVGQAPASVEARYVLNWSDGNSITFVVLDGKVSTMTIAKGHGGHFVEGGGC